MGKTERTKRCVVFALRPVIMVTRTWGPEDVTMGYNQRALVETSARCNTMDGLIESA